MAESSQHRALGALSLAVGAAFAGIAISAGSADKWVILGASLRSRSGWPRGCPPFRRYRRHQGERRSAPYSLGGHRGRRHQAALAGVQEVRDRALRDRLILTYAPLVKFVAGRLGSGLPAHVDEGDLVSYGLLGLIGAIERYDPDRDVKFETYAISRIKGAIIDELRAMDWVPRSVRARARDIERAIGALEAKLHRAPTDEEIAEKLGLTTDELDDSLTDISRSSIAALDELWRRLLGAATRSP